MIGLAVLALGGAGAGWALTVILAPPGAGTGAAGAFTTVTVTEGEVGSRLALNVAAEWQASPVGTNAAAGVVTSVDVAAGATASQGQRLYSVDSRPVVAAQGAVPAFRPIGAGSAGPDAAQLQTLLADLGFFDGAVDGTIGPQSVAAIEDWQDSLGEEASGVVQEGDVVFVPSLPARLTLKTDVVRRGARLGGGEEVVLALEPSPRFTLPVGEGQSSQIPTGARVEITGSGGRVWAASVAGRAAAASGGTVVLALGPAPAGTAASPSRGATVPGSICGEECDSVPVDGQTLLPAEIVTVEALRGAVVPSIALRSNAGHELMLLDEHGIEHPVTVTAQARGMSVVEGVEPGLRVRVPASSDRSGAGGAGGGS